MLILATMFKNNFFMECINKNFKKKIPDVKIYDKCEELKSFVCWNKNLEIHFSYFILYNNSNCNQFSI